MSRGPSVTFVVPCYKLAHLLRQCVESILSQTFGQLEILIMDDCSPDDTAEVANSFGDARVVHVRNEPNLGHLRNYNKGIGLARGKYVWLISADDYLRRPYVLQRYVNALERHPAVGYTVCPGVGVRDGVETQVIDYSVSGRHDRVVPGHQWLKRLLPANIVVAASGLVRRECYLSHGAFPLDMPYAGDWYLWSLFAFHHDVAYFAEAMVCYREHTLSMTTHLTREKVQACAREEISIPWAIKARADEAGLKELSRDCLTAVAQIYGRNLAQLRFGMATPILELGHFEESLREHSGSESERDFVRAHVYANMGNEYYWRGDAASAHRLYGAAFRKDPFMLGVLAKRMLLSSGWAGNAVRRLIRRSRSRADAGTLSHQ